MKQVAIYAVAVVLTLHALAVAGFMGWLRYTGRLDHDRAMRVVAMFKPTIEQEAKAKAEEEQKAKDAAEKATEVARMAKVAAGPLTLEDRIRAEGMSEDIATQRYERLQRETADLNHQLDLAKALLRQQKSELDEQRKAFTEAAQREEKLRDDQAFQQTLEMYQQLKPSQAKAMFQDLIKSGKSEQVLDYLAMMQQRKAASILKEFKTPEELGEAADLMERMRARARLPADAPPGAPGSSPGSAGASAAPGGSGGTGGPATQSAENPA